MSNPESEIEQGATVLNISSVCPRCGEVFCREHNVYGLAVNRLTDALERVKKERDELIFLIDTPLDILAQQPGQAWIKPIQDAYKRCMDERDTLQSRCDKLEKEREQLEAKCAAFRDLVLLSDAQIHGFAKHRDELVKLAKACRGQPENPEL